VKVGDRVAVESLLTCGVCEHCLSGSRNTCGHQIIYGFTPTTTAPALWGAYADYLFLHADTIVHRMSNALPASVAALYNPMGAGVRWAVNTPSMRTGDTVVVLGAGQRGLACVIAAKAAGAGKIIVTDISGAAHKLDLALELGAHHAIVADEDSVVEQVTRHTGGRMADIVVDVCGATQALVDAVDLVRWGGTIVLAGLKGDGVGTTLLTDKMVMRTIALRGVFTVDPISYRQAIQLIESGAAPFGKLRSGTYGLEDAEAAIHRLAGWDGKPPAVHVVIDPQHRL
jgi:threonine dehydrogenase-like Zn-dependent dehydrogenase